jgi:hypothetical protein
VTLIDILGNRPHACEETAMVAVAPSVPKLSVAVMTHPARLTDARRLRSELRTGGDSDTEVVIACDPAPHEGPSTLRSARLAWRQTGTDATHHLVVQDDIQVHPHFLAHVVDAVTRHPDRALSFFTEWGSATATAVRIAALRGDAWVPVVDHYVPTQALVMPAAVARDVDAFLAPLPTQAVDDEALRDFLSRQGVEALVSVRNLLQHSDAPSIFGNSYMGLRRGACYRPDLAESGVPAGPVLDHPAVLPCFSWWDRAAEFRLWDAPGDVAWHSRPIAELFETVGMAPDRLGDGLVAAVASLTEALPHRIPVPGAALADLWATACAIGLLAVRGADRSIEDSLRRPEAQVSLQTLAPGALRLIADHEELTRWAGPFTEFVIDAVRAGATAELPGVFPDHYLPALHQRKRAA